MCLGSVGFLKASAEDAQSNPLKRFESFIFRTIAVKDTTKRPAGQLLDVQLYLNNPGVRA